MTDPGQGGPTGEADPGVEAGDPPGGTGEDPSDGVDDGVDYREVFEKLSDGVLVHDPETGRVLDANPAMCEMVGLEREELIGGTVSDFSVVEEGYTEARARGRIRKAAEEGPQVFEWRNQGPDGDPFWVEVNLQRTEFGGEDRVLAVVRDVEQRKQLEGSLESLQSATDHLVRAETSREACERAVEAAEAVLPFPMVGVHLYDEDGSALEPVAHTDEVERVLGGAPPTIESGSGPTWRAFAAGEPVHHEDLRTLAPDGVEPPVRSQLSLPLGSHGAMVVAAPDPGGFDDEAVELAEILAANVEAALNRAEGRRRLREREQELQRETERAERMAQLNRIVRDVEAALVEASTASGIERRVCDRLAAADGCLQAWIGDQGRGEECPTPRTATDADGRDPVDADLATVPESHPARVAAGTGEASAMQDLVADAPCGEWRRRAINREAGSACAVPLTHGDVDHGVLCVYADEVGAFGDGVRETLSELGRSIGYALTAVERRRALESDTTTELEFRIADRGLAPVDLAERTGHRVTLERSVRRSDGDVGVFYTVESDEGVDEEPVLASLRAVPEVESARVVNHDDRSCLLEATATEWFGSLFADQGGVVRSATVSQGVGTLVVETPSTADVRGLVETFRDRFPETELLARRDGRAVERTPLQVQATLEAELTDRQREVLETAYSAGYFEWPRESSGEEIAELLGITQPTLNKHLRLAERTAVSLLLEGDPGE